MVIHVIALCAKSGAPPCKCTSPLNKIQSSQFTWTLSIPLIVARPVDRAGEWRETGRWGENETQYRKEQLGTDLAITAFSDGDIGRAPAHSTTKWEHTSV